MHDEADNSNAHRLSQVAQFSTALHVGKGFCEFGERNLVRELTIERVVGEFQICSRPSDANTPSASNRLSKVAARTRSNVSRALAKNDVRTVAVFPGDDLNGRWIIDALERERVETVSVPISDEVRQNIAIVDEAGHDVEKGKGGFLVIKRPWPSMIRTIWGDPERFKKTYYPEDFQGRYYLAGDGATTDLDGYYRIMGRIDDVLNVSGHRLGTMEIESALVANPIVAEAAVVGRPDDLTGEAVCAFVVLKQARPTGDEAKKIVKQLQDWVGHEIGAIAKPKDIRFGDNLPKTRSGKIMRRLLRSIAKGEEITQDVSTLENPAILQQLKEGVG